MMRNSSHKTDNNRWIIKYSVMLIDMAADVQSLIDQIAELSDDAQTELVQSLLLMYAEHLGLDQLDDDR